MGIEDRIRAAMGSSRRAKYHDLMRAVFPPDKYPKAWNYQANGGPPGCAMAFGAALRRMGFIALGVGGDRVVFAKNKETQS